MFFTEVRVNLIFYELHLFRLAAIQKVLVNALRKMKMVLALVLLSTKSTNDGTINKF